jgi:hypothetical protein
VTQEPLLSTGGRCDVSAVIGNHRIRSSSGVADPGLASHGTVT